MTLKADENISDRVIRLLRECHLRLLAPPPIFSVNHPVSQVTEGSAKGDGEACRSGSGRIRWFRRCVAPVMRWLAPNPGRDPRCRPPCVFLCSHVGLLETLF